MKSRFMTVAAALAIGLTAQSASAATLNLDGGWQTFSFGGVGSSWSDTFTFNLAGTAQLKVTDAFQAGDQFEVFINAISQGATSAPTGLGDQIGSDYDTAFADPRWSSGSYILGPGSYTISGTTLLSPFQGGGAAIELVTVRGAVPEPAAWLTLILGFGALGFAMRARTSKKVALTYA